MPGKTIDMILELEEDTASAYRKWKKAAKKELDFYLGDQWKPADKAKVESEGRPALTFNEIQPIIRLISGYERQNRKDIKVVGVEGGDDFIANIMTLLIKNIMTRSYGEYKLSQMFLNGIQTSKGWVEPDVVYADDPVNGCIKLKNNLYYEVFPDPDYMEYDMSDAEFLIKPLRMTKARLLKFLPEYEKKINKIKQVSSPFDEIVSLEDDPTDGYEKEKDSGPDDGIPYTRSERRKLYDLTICWYKKYEKKIYIVDVLSGDVQDITDRGLTVRDQKQMLGTINRAGQQIAFLHQRVGVPWVAIKSGNELLEDIISPEWPNVKTFPIAPYVASFNPAGKTPEKIFQGLVKALLDPQEEQNKRISQRLHLVNTSANEIWIGDEDAFTTEGWKDFQNRKGIPGYVARPKKGARLERITPTTQGQMHTIMAEESSQKLKTISGINPDLLAQQDKTTSGRALAIRQQQGIMIIQDVFDNRKYSGDILGRLLIGMILNNYTPEKIVRICGEKKPVMGPVIDPQTGQVIGEQQIDETGEISYQEAKMVLDSFDMLKYDLAIDETQLSPVMRMAVSEELMQLREKGILPPGVADDLIVDGMSIPNKEEIKQRLAQFQQQMQQMAGGQPGPQA